MALNSLQIIDRLTILFRESMPSSVGNIDAETGRFCAAVSRLIEEVERDGIDDGYVPKEQDAKLYREMCVPHESPQAAQKAMDQFFADVGKARKKARIPDVLVAAEMYVEHDEGESPHFVMLGFGNHGNRERLAAYSMGRTQAEREQLIGSAVADGGAVQPRGRKRSG